MKHPILDAILQGLIQGATLALFVFSMVSFYLAPRGDATRDWVLPLAASTIALRCWWPDNKGTP